MKWVRAEDGEQELELKMLAVLVGAEQPDAFSDTDRDGLERIAGLIY